MMMAWPDPSDTRVDFVESVLGLYLGRRAHEVFGRGRVLTLLPGGSLVLPQGSLTVLLRGQLSGDSRWWGPGNHLLDVPGPLRAGEHGARIWTLTAGVGAGQTHLLDALMAAEAAEQAALASFRLPPAENPCNHEHPLIRHAAARLRGDSPAASAEAVFRFVQRMPYRFGGWHERASDTLLRGAGVCTAKAHLQVALWRALGLQAGFIEIELPMRVLSLLMPARWVPLMRARVRHYCAAVLLEGQWLVADASFSDETIRLFIEADPSLAPHGHTRFGVGQPFHPVAGIVGLDPFDVEVRPDLIGTLNKRSRFEVHHFEALNTRLDKVHGLHHVWTQRLQPLSWPGKDIPADGSDVALPASQADHRLT
ncbi:MAG TPA: transglutaminase family protein [Hydrogenophaga sp.]|uniref:transglutaminase-like domain-containing protein n=1 Tax=Hydrogenophaga sp. TaxID=1904254 RepID=UPI002C0AFDE5|nr:transglutaminase family protein [Hydrogenophaga sp.]HMN94345.1 transglutaminase family protein [Hydrogenophaga sp.]HMP11078.1 transglutaminase family protein [Hydrogenophaga sp.]